MQLLSAIRVRAPLCLQAVLAACCVACADFYTQAHRHPVGLPYELLGLARCASLLLLVWFACEVVCLKMSPWRRLIVLATGLLLLGVTFLATDTAFAA
jgi:hypothetical protein